MKYILIVGDGMADRPLPELSGKTPLEYAKTPNMDFLASNGTSGKLRTLREGGASGTDVAHFSIFSYAESEYSGRAPLEAAAMGIALNEKDIAARCNLVTLKNGLMDDYSAGHVSTEEARELI
ncbi:MAG: phosphoglycerate mutase, partial [Candidatus Micrarchaeota archaeon]